MSSVQDRLARRLAPAEGEQQNAGQSNEVGQQAESAERAQDTGRDTRGAESSSAAPESPDPKASTGRGGKGAQRGSGGATGASKGGRGRAGSVRRQAPELDLGDDWTPPPMPVYDGEPAGEIPTTRRRAALLQARAYASAAKKAHEQWAEWAREVESLRAIGVSEDELVRLAAEAGAQLPPLGTPSGRAR